MFSLRAIRTLKPTTTITTKTITKPTTTHTLALFSTTTPKMGKDTTVSASPPKHEMVHFPGLTSTVRSFGVFRKVMHTGLYSQLVTMEIPPGGDIGDEVHMKDQVLIFTSGEGKAVVAGREQVLILPPPLTRIYELWYELC